MAKYPRGIIVFGLGILVVSLWCMKVNASGEYGYEELIHTVRREEGGGCHSSQSEGVQECTDEDDHLGLYTDVDDTFKVAKKMVSHFEEGSPEDDDSPDVAHNNVDVLGH